MHLRLIVPPDRSKRVLDTLVGDPRVTSIVRLPGAAHQPEGDVIECDVTREATSEILGRLKDQGLYDDGSVALAVVDSAPSRNARETEKAAPGAPDDLALSLALWAPGHVGVRRRSSGSTSSE